MRSKVSKFLDDNFIFLLIFGLLFIMAARTPLDTDMWWHLKVGEHMVQTRSILTVDIYSHTRFGETWVNHSWLSQVFMYLVYRYGGSFLLSGWVALIVSISIGLLYFQMDTT